MTAPLLAAAGLPGLLDRCRLWWLPRGSDGGALVHRWAGGGGLVRCWAGPTRRYIRLGRLLVAYTPRRGGPLQ